MLEFAAVLVLAALAALLWAPSAQRWAKGLFYGVALLAILLWATLKSLGLLLLGRRLSPQ